MVEQYALIANKLGLAENTVHLVHFVLKQMKTCCVFPPDPDRQSGNFYSPFNVCAAVLAYVRSKYPDNVSGTLKDFGISKSVTIGTVVEAIQSNKKTQVVRDLKVQKKSFAGLFQADEIDPKFFQAYWGEGLQENESPKIDVAAQLLRRHFRDTPLDSLVISKRKFPQHVRADLQVALNEILPDGDGIQLWGMSQRSRHEGLDFLALCEVDERVAPRIGPLTYSDINVGGSDRICCLTNGLWLGTNGESTLSFAVLLGAAAAYSSMNNIQVEIAVPQSPEHRAFAQSFLLRLEQHVESSKCYRGKVLSFERSSDYRGYSQGINVHALREVDRDEVILPQETLDILDRNIIDFVKQRPALARRGMNLKKGVLLFGPPGTGKTHTVHYLARAMPGTTTLVITAEQVGLLSEYMTLARLLQPSLVVIEDADLIARQREDMDVCEEVLLNKLLNEMDGLRSDAEIIFILTTNRPESLEAALTTRPGRIDQAIEYPLPNRDGRARLARLYAGTQSVQEDVIDTIVGRTEGTSAAFIKELMRRATQYAITRDETAFISSQDVETAVDELLFSGGVFNRRILGAAEQTTED